MAGKTRDEIKQYSDPIAAHMRVTMVTGIASKSGNGSVAITGISAAVDGLFECFYLGATGSAHGQVTPASLSLVPGTTRLQIEVQDTTSKALQLFWWDRK